MRYSAVAVALSALTTFASAQNFTIDPNSVSLSTRSSWCAGQQNTCSTLCSNNLDANTCDPSTLNYTCTCGANSSSPGLQYYTQTIPTYICNQAFADCNLAAAGNATGQKECKTDIQDKCATLDPAKADLSSPTTSSSAAATTTVAATHTNTEAATTTAAASSAAAATSSSSKAGAMPTAMAKIGNGVAIAAAGVFALML